eukprot:g1201.t1
MAPTTKLLVLAVCFAACSALTPSSYYVDINSADEDALDELYGVGKATAREIIAGRPYSTLDDLAKVTYLSEAKVQLMKTKAEEWETTGQGTKRPFPVAGPLKFIDINTATKAELDQLWGVGPATADEIIAWRTANGPFDSIDDLVYVKYIAEAKIETMLEKAHHQQLRPMPVAIKPSPQQPQSTKCSHTTCEMVDSSITGHNGSPYKVMQITHSNEESVCHKHHDTHIGNPIKWDETGNKMHCKIMDQGHITSQNHNTQCECHLLGTIGSLPAAQGVPHDISREDVPETHGTATVNHSTEANPTQVTAEQSKTNANDVISTADRINNRNQIV